MQYAYRFQLIKTERLKEDVICELKGQLRGMVEKGKRSQTIKKLAFASLIPHNVDPKAI